MFFVEICANNLFNFFSFCLEYFLVFFQTQFSLRSLFSVVLLVLVFVLSDLGCVVFRLLLIYRSFRFECSCFQDLLP